MKSKFTFALILFLDAVAGAATDKPASPPTAETTDANDGRRLVSLLDYVAADYGGAVSNGAVLSAFEYEEQLAFLQTAAALVPKATRTSEDAAALTARIEALRAAVRGKQDASIVAAIARAAREDVVARLGLITTPGNRPSLTSAEALYSQSCAVCHGADGRAATAVSASLNPKPTSFKDPGRRGALSPYRVYNALTLGVQGTAMPAFEALSPAERWDLAFYVLRLSHGGEPAAGPVTMALADLAVRSDVELLASLQAGGHPSPQEGLAFARREAAFSEAPLGLGVDQTRSLVRKAASLGANRRIAEADRVVLDAYLQGFEPLEAQISARNPNQTQSVEIAFRDFRAALAGGNPALIQKQAGILDELLSRSGSKTGDSLPFVAAFIIYFREGVEAALLVGALLGGVRRLGRSDAGRAIHAGWISALAAGGVSWFLFSRLIAIAPSQREMVEAFIGLLAALVLFSVSFWMISKAESRKWTAFLKDRMNRGLSSGRVWSFAGIAFLAVYRECAETILFTEALLIESEGNVWPVYAGACAGALGVVLVAVAIRNAFQRLPLPVFFGASGILLSFLAVAFAGSSISAFVAAGYLAPRPIAFPSVPMLGIHPDLSSLAVQGVLVGLLAIAAMKTLMDWRQPDRT